MSVVYFLVLLGVLVVIHELGHFIAAKLLDFKVLRFSIGFGRPILRIRGRETDYQLALFPLGGYVRILGDDPDEQIPAALKHRAFNHKPLWQRLVVVFAGPFANFCLPIAIYFVTFAGDSELPAAVVGDVMEHSPADRAGLLPGDEVLNIDETETHYWQDVVKGVNKNPGKELRFVLRRGNETFERYITPVNYQQHLPNNGTGETKITNEGMIGVTHAPFLPQVGVTAPNSPAGLAGFKTGDRVLSIDGSLVRNWRDLTKVLDSRPRRMNVTYVRGHKYSALGIMLLAPGHADLISREGTFEDGRPYIQHGLAPAEMFIARVESNSPADHAGLRVGDVITSLEGSEVRHWMTLERHLQSQPDRQWVIGWTRNVGGDIQQMSGTLRQVWRQEKDEFGHSTQRLVFGAESDFEQGQGKMTLIDGRLSYAASRAVEHGFEAIFVTTSSFLSVLTGLAPSEKFGGPLMMFRVASVSGKKGWDALFRLIALVSISVGLINLLPIPELDGGHILLFAIEAVRRRPLSLQARSHIATAGLFFMGFLTLLALRNDVIHYIL